LHWRKNSVSHAWQTISTWLNYYINYTIERVVDSENLIYGWVFAFVSSYHSIEKSSVCCPSWNYDDFCSLMLINDFTGVNLTNQMWFGVVCTLIDNDMHHHSGQNVVDLWNTAEWVHNKFWPLWWQSVCEISCNRSKNMFWYLLYQAYGSVIWNSTISWPPPATNLPAIWHFELSPGQRMVSYQVIKCTYPVTFAKLSNRNADWVSMECRLSIDQVLIKCRLRVLTKGIDRHSTMDVFSTHNPAYL